jgi:hypothetical protein
MRPDAARLGGKAPMFGGVIVGVLVIVGSLIGVAYGLSTGVVRPEVSLPVLAVSAVILLLGTLSIVSIAFALFDIDDKTQALGLPEGSIRAVIALSLIVLFAVFSVYFYGSMATGRIGHVYNLSDEQDKSFVAHLAPGQIISDVTEASKLHTVYFKDRPDPASDDFAKQILTVLGTLVTAIASFYFGSKTASQAMSVAQALAAGSGAGPGPQPSSLTPNSGPRGTSQSLVISGANLGTVDHAKIKLGASEIPAKAVLSNAGAATAAFDIPDDAALGVYDLILTAAGVDYPMPTAFTVTDAQLPGSRDQGDDGPPDLKTSRGGVSPTPGQGALHVTGPVQPAAGAPGPTGAVSPGFGYHGGAVLTSPQVYVSFWGDAWATDQSHQARAGRLIQFQQDLMASTFMNVLSQYGVGRGAVASHFVVNGVSGQLDAGAIESTLQSCIDKGQLPEPTDGQTCVMIYLQEGVSVQDGTITMCAAISDDAFGFHSFFVTSAQNRLYFSMIPSLDDACVRSSCPAGDSHCSLSLTKNQEQRQTQVASHEFAEMTTDPHLDGWFDHDLSHENGDLCNGESATITVSGRTWTVQRTYNKTGDTGGAGATPCLSEAPSPIPRLPDAPN